MAYRFAYVIFGRMGFDDIKNWSFKFFKKLGRRDIFKTVVVLVKTVKDLSQEIKKYKEENQRLKDLVNELRGEKGKPDIKPPADSEGEDDDDEDTGGEAPKNKNHKKRSKNKTIKIDREIKLSTHKSLLPADAQNKGTREIIIQDIKLSTDNVKFIISVYDSPSQKKTYEAQVPPEYQGSEFGPGIWSFVKQMHTEGRLTQNVMWKILTGMGIDISEGQISNIILGNKGVDFNSEMQAARTTVMKKQDYLGIDDTRARIEGKNGARIVTGNDYFAAYFTHPSKNRLSACTALSGKYEMVYCLNKTAMDYISDKISNRDLVKKLSKIVSKTLYTEIDFFQKVMNLPWIKSQIPSWKKHVRDGCAIGALRLGIKENLTSILICDDAPQFKGILEGLGLCWVHEGRHYKKLEPTHEEFKEEKEKFLERFWDYYEKLKKYKLKPSVLKKMKLRVEFDELFSGKSNYYALNFVMKKTREKKEMLLLVLEHPQIPLYNNASELVVRESVIQRKIRFGFRSWDGAKASDLYLSLMATCRKLKISFGEYLKARFYFRGKIPALASIIQAAP